MCCTRPARSPRVTGRWALQLTPLLALTLACSVPVATNLEDEQANRVVRGLQDNGVVAEKEPSSTNVQHYDVSVARSDAPRALSVLVADQLLAPEPDGIKQWQAESLLLDRDAEAARRAQALAGEIERTLLGLDEVISARVHLALPATTPLRPALDPSAAVLLRHRGEDSPLDENAIRQLVAAAVPQLQAAHVQVTLLPAAKLPPAPPLVQLGPFRVAQTSAPTLRAFAFGLIGLNLLLLAVVAVLWWQQRRLRRDQAGSAADRVPPMIEGS